MNEVKNFTDKTEFMAHCARELMEKYPKNSNFRFVAGQVGVTPSTFERILKKEVQSPSFANVIKIVRAACSDGEIRTFIEKFYPDMLKDFQYIYPGNAHLPFAEPEAEEFFKMSSTYEIMLFAVNTPDLTRQEVGMEFGRKGLTILDQLIQRNIIKKDGEKIYIQGPLNLEQPALHALFKNLLNQNYDLDNFGNKDNWLSLNTQAVDLEKAMPLLREVCAKANKEIVDILDDPQLKGKDIVWTGLVMDNVSGKKSNDENVTKNTGGLIQ